LLEIEQQRRFSWLQNITSTVANVDGQATFSLPAGLRSIDSISPIRDDGTMDDALTVLSLGRIRMLASQLPPGTFPSNYALSNGTIYLDQPALAGQSFEIIGTASTPDDIPTAIAAAGMSPTIQRFVGLIVAGTCADIALTYLHDEAKSARYRVVFERRLERLADREDEERGDDYGGSIVPDTAYRDMAGGYCGR
jgi:hypothetical protein